MPEPSAGIKDYYMFLLAQAHILNKFVDKFNKFDQFLAKNNFKQTNKLEIKNLDSIKNIVKELDIKKLKEEQEETTEEPSSEPAEEPSPSNELVDEFVKSRFYTDLGELATTLNSFVENFIKMWKAGLKTETQPAAIEYITKYTATDKTPDTLEAEPSIAIDIREFNQQMKILRQYYDFFMENVKPILKSLKADPELNPNVTAAQPAGQEQDSISSDLSDAQAVIAALEGIEETGKGGLEKIYDIYTNAAKINAAEQSAADGWVDTQIEKIQSYYNSEGKQTTSMVESILMEVSRLGLGDEFRLAIMRALNRTLGLNPDAQPWLSAVIKEFHKTDFYEKIEDPKVKRGLTYIVNQLFNNQTISEDLRFAKLQIDSHTNFGGKKFDEALTKLNSEDGDIAEETLKFFYMKRNGTNFAHVVKNLQTTAKAREKKKKAREKAREKGRQRKINQRKTYDSKDYGTDPTRYMEESKENLLEKLIKEQLKVLNGKKMVCN